MTAFASPVHIVGRYPELAQDEAFLQWLGAYGAHGWHETPANDDGLITVIVESSDRLNMFAALLRRETSRENARFGHGMVRTSPIDATQHNLTSAQAVLTARREASLSDARLHALRPTADLNSGSPRLGWEAEFDIGHAIQVIRIAELEGASLISERKVEQVQVQGAAKPAAAFMVPDWQEENELHHPSIWRQVALGWAGNLTSMDDQAFAVFWGTMLAMQYDDTITHINEFTWSDNLVIWQNGWKGVCDEWAVIQVTMLRALGIPASLKLMIFAYPGAGIVGHAAVEWHNGSVWRHMDALWNAFDHPAVYRGLGATSVSVMDATYPVDSRYSGPAWGVQDVVGDGRFYPYGDFLINPSYPGNYRPGYSY